MIDLKWLEADTENVLRKLKKRGEVPAVKELLLMLEERRQTILETQKLQEARNEANLLMRDATPEKLATEREKLRNLSQSIKSGEKKLADLEAAIETLALLIPNVPKDEVPEGTSSEDNVVFKIVGEKPVFRFSPKDHVELGLLTNTIDLSRAAKISGARFAFLRGLGSRLNRALMQYMLDFHEKEGDIELTSPFMVRETAMLDSGQFPKFREEAFRVQGTDQQPYYLIPTAEVPMTNYLADEIIPEASLPLRFCGYSPCFRAEAGAAGRDTRGIIRLHQFEKVEMVRFCKLSDSEKELQMMVDRASRILQTLEIPHRVMLLCGGDLGFCPDKTFDLEAFLPGQDTYREISSCSSFGTYQSRRAKIRFRPEKELGSGKPELLGTLNGSGLPLGRTIVAIYENHQQADGSINIPKVLRPYMGGIERIPLAP